MAEQKNIGYDVVYIDSLVPSVDVYRVGHPERVVLFGRQPLQVVAREYFETFTRKDWERLNSFKGNYARKR